MTFAVLLRLIPEMLRRGEAVGSATVVDSGESTVVRSTNELTAWLREQSRIEEGRNDAAADEVASGDDGEPDGCDGGAGWRGPH